MKKGLFIAALSVFSIGSLFAQNTVELDFTEKRQEILGNGINMEGYHTSGGSEVLKSSISTMLSTMTCDYVRIGMCLPTWESANDDDDPFNINFDGFKTTASTMVNSFDRIVRMNNEGRRVWLSVWDFADWNITNTSSSVRRVIADQDEFVESVCAYLLWVKQEYGVEVDWVSVNEPSVASENGWGGYNLYLTAEEQASVIQKGAALFKANGLSTQWIIAVHKIYPSEITYAEEVYDIVYNDEETRPYLYGFDFHAYYLNTSTTNLTSWGELMQKTGLPSICGELDHHSNFWELSADEKADWEWGAETALLYARVYNLAYASMGSPWYSHSPSSTTPYRYVASHYHEHMPKGTQVVGYTSSNNYIHVVASEYGDDWTAILYNQYTSAREVTLQNIPEGTTSVQVIASYEGNYGVRLEEIPVVGGEITISLEGEGIYSLGSNLVDLDELIIGEEDEEEETAPFDVPETAVQAESGTCGGGATTSSSLDGYTGTGYVDFGGIDSWNEVTMTMPSAGDAYLYIRYASTENRPCDVYLNGTLETSCDLGNTGGWTTWGITEVCLPFVEGDNTIKLMANSSSGGPNIDLYFWATEAGVSGIENKKDITIYPNPVSSTLYVEGLEDATYTFTVSDLSGSSVIRCTAENQIDVSTLISGIYILSIEGNNTVKSLTFIKK